MKTIFPILLITFISLANKSYSQKIINLNANANTIRSLNQYGKIDVISNVPDSNILGFIPSDNLNDREFVKSAKSITPWLQDFVDKQFAPGGNKNAPKLLWVIQGLSAGKDSTQKQAYSFVKLKADIYTDNPQNNSAYQLINTFDSTWISSSQSAELSEMVSSLLLALYRNSSVANNGPANVRFQQMAKATTVTMDEAIQNAKLSNNYSILNSDHIHGIYTSFEEFKNNKPSIKNFYADVNQQSNKVEVYEITADSSSKLIHNLWGLSINNELYYYSSGQLYPIEKSGNTFYLAKYLEPAIRRNQAFYWRKYVGAKQSDNNPYNDAHVLKKTVPTAKGISLEATHLDFDSAEFTY